MELNIDSIGMQAEKLPGEDKITVLRIEGRNWKESEVNAIIKGITPVTEIHQHSHHHGVLVVRTEVSEGKIARILGNADFECEIITGFDNPNLPFKLPPF